MKNIKTFDLFEMSKISSIEYTKFIKNFFFDVEKNIEKDLSAIFSKKVVFTDKNYSLLDSSNVFIDEYIKNLNFDNSIDFDDKFCADYRFNIDPDTSMNTYMKISFLITDRLCTIETVYFYKLDDKPGKMYNFRFGEKLEIYNNSIRLKNYVYNKLIETIKKDSKKFN